jgi:hypothetical protein
MSRPEAWRQAAAWALDRLEARLGHEWPALVIERSPDHSAGELAWTPGNTIAYVNLLEFALRIELLDGIPGHAKARRAIAKDPRPDQLVHAGIQHEVAALCLQHDLPTALEPERGRRPADVEFRCGDSQLIVETRAILTSVAWRDEQRQIDDVYEHIHAMERAYGVRCEGTLTDLPDATAARDLLRTIEGHARLLAIGAEAPPLRSAYAQIRVVRDGHRPIEALHGPGMSGNLSTRVRNAIGDKAEVARESGATWLRLDARNGLWQFTPFATRSLGAKLDLIATLARPELGDMHGLVISSGSVWRQGEFQDEDVEADGAAFALRRCIAPIRVRETLVISADGDSNLASEARRWRDLYADESAWLPWALERAGLWSLGDIFGLSRVDSH